MTENKRLFGTKKGYREHIIDCTGRLYSESEAADLLNELYEENYILKEKNKYLEEYNNKLLKKPFLTDILPNAIEIMNTNKKLENENEQLKQVLGSILLEVKRDITNTICTGEVKTFINPDSFDLISDVLRRYGSLKEWYDD